MTPREFPSPVNLCHDSRHLLHALLFVHNKQTHFVRGRRVLCALSCTASLHAKQSATRALLELRFLAIARKKSGTAEFNRKIPERGRWRVPGGAPGNVPGRNLVHLSVIRSPVMDNNGVAAVGGCFLRPDTLPVSAVKLAP